MASSARRSASSAGSSASATSSSAGSRGSEHSTVSEGFVDASLLFCVGSLTVVGSIQDGLTGDYQTLATKAVLDGFASIALSAALGWGVGLSAITILLVQGTLTLGAGVFDDVLQGEALAVLTSAGGVTVMGIALKLLGIKDVKVGNFLPALVIAPALSGCGAWCPVSAWPQVRTPADDRGQSPDRPRTLGDTPSIPFGIVRRGSIHGRSGRPARCRPTLEPRRVARDEPGGRAHRARPAGAAARERGRVVAAPVDDHERVAGVGVDGDALPRGPPGPSS